MPFIKAKDGTNLFWREWGEGAPILFLSGQGCGSAMWDYQFAALADQGFRCIGLDRRGHGRSDEPARGYDHDTLAGDIATLIDDLDLTGLTLITHSMGGGEAVRYLSRHGAERVARLVLLAPTTPVLLKSADNPDGIPREGFEAVWADWKRDYPKWVEDATPSFFVAETSAATMRAAPHLIEASIPVLLACSKSTLAEDFRTEMRSITVPTLLIHGDRDVSAPLALTGEPSAKLIPGCRFITYQDAPHGLMFTHMDRLHADLLQFMRDTWSSADRAA